MLQCAVPDLQIHTRQLHEIAVMDNHDFAVSSLLDIYLDPVGSILNRLVHGGEGVFGRLAGSPAVSDDQDIIMYLNTVQEPGSDQCSN